MLSLTSSGLYCAAGDFYIDPARKVARAIITHAHSDHARPGSEAYLCARECVDVLRVRLGPRAKIEGWPYGVGQSLNGVHLSFHPAGHVLGSAQIRLEHRGQVWVVSGDYNTTPDPTCAPFAPVPCHVFVTECTFGLPLYRWPATRTVFSEIHHWWRSNQERGQISVLCGYSLGKAQRLLAGLNPEQGPIYADKSVLAFLPAYAAARIPLPPVQPAAPDILRATAGRAIVVTPPGTNRSILADESTAFASGWMLLRRHRRARPQDRGFVLSDHADWPGLIQAIRATGAERILATHGTTAPLIRWLNENGWQADALESAGSGGAAGSSNNESGEPC